MSLSNRFVDVSTADSFVRVDSNHKHNIYVGKNIKMQKTIVVIGEAESFLVKSTNSIDVNLNQRSDGNYALSFTLLDSYYESIFLKFCEDIISSTASVPPINVIGYTAKRWLVWLQLFKKASGSILSEEKIRGLVGELLFIKKYLVPKHGIEEALKFWVGPEGNPKDFITEDSWFEIKTTTPSKKTVMISSLEQLTSDNDGNLVVIRIQSTSSKDIRGFNLNDLVTEIIAIAEHDLVFEDLYRKLQDVGYSYSEEYLNYCFKYESTSMYIVNDQFPRIDRNLVDESIVNASYELLLSGLEKVKVEIWK